jgi:hypothetical protein
MIRLAAASLNTRVVWQTAAAIALSIAGSAARPQGAVPADPAVEAAMQKFLDRESNPHQYRASRRLEASGSGQRAWLQAQTDFTPEDGLRYEVTAEGGSGYIRSRVLRSMLDEEQQLIARGATAGVALSRENYRFSPESIDADGLAVVAVTPLRKERALVIGKIYLTSEGDLVRLEGRLAKTPSFWLSRVEVTRSYRRLNGALVPMALKSRAQMRLLGRSTLEMTYQYSEIDYRAVSDEALSN